MIIDLEEVRDIKKWVGDNIEEIHGHTAPHHYRFKRVGEEVERPTSTGLMMRSGNHQSAILQLI